jgi:glyoxylase-like metal-dependent hydrolase (beta-lactamase superfamily II)
MFFKRFLSTNYLNNYTQHHPLFKHYQLTQNVWRIEEKYFDSWNLANIFYIRGSTSDLLVDTGIGVHDLPSFLRWSGLRPDPDKPLKVALTHTHFDHSGGAHQFAQVYLNESMSSIQAAIIGF